MRGVPLGDRLAIGACVVASLAAVVGLSFTGSDERQRPQPTCTPHRAAWICEFPTPGHPARMFVLPFEDGSAVVRVMDRDGR